MSLYYNPNHSPNFIKFHPQLCGYFGSAKVPCLMGYLEYWFSKEKFYKGFFKFIEPCAHRLYKQGDSWAESLGWKGDTFKKMFDQIGVRYTSKTAYKKAAQEGDPFQEKFYLSYYDRKTNQTFFIRNHNVLENFLSKLKNISFSTRSSAKKHSEAPQKNQEREKHQKSQIKTEKEVLENRPKENFSEKNQQLKDQKNLSSQYCNAKKSLSPIYTKENTYNISSNALKTEKETKEDEDINDIASKMIYIWESNIGYVKNWCKNHNNLIKISKSLNDFFEGSLEKWKEYCKKIASSKFLMGETKTKFKIWIQWAIKQDAVERINQDGFSFGDRTTVVINKIPEEIKKKAVNIFDNLTEKEKDEYLIRYLDQFRKTNMGIVISIETNGLQDNFIKSSFRSYVIDLLIKEKLEIV
jgi:hypothetical protein